MNEAEIDAEFQRTAEQLAGAMGDLSAVGVAATKAMLRMAAEMRQVAEVGLLAEVRAARRALQPPRWEMEERRRFALAARAARYRAKAISRRPPELRCRT